MIGSSDNGVRCVEIRVQYVSQSVEAGTRDPSEERVLDAQFVQGLS